MIISRRAFLFSFVVLVFAMTPATATTEDEQDRDVRILDVDTLRADPIRPVIFDLQPEEDYLKAHIRPALPLDVNELETLLLSTPEPEGERLLAYLAKKPLAKGNPIVLYDLGGPLFLRGCRYDECQKVAIHLLQDLVGAGHKRAFEHLVEHESRVRFA